MTELVFEEPQVPRTRPLGAIESKVNWFLKSTRPAAVEGRRVVNDMYSRFPDHTKSLRRRLRSRADIDVRTALDELLVHDLVKRRYSVEYEGGAGRTRPDFMLYDGTEHVATVEVVSLMLRGEWNIEERRHGRLQDALNYRLTPTTHFIDFEIQRHDGDFDADDLVSWVLRNLADLAADPQALPTGCQGVPANTYEHASGRLTVHFWPVPVGYAPKAGHRIVISGPAIGGFINSAQRLRGLLASKAEKYDLQGKPLAIVIGIDDPMCDLDDVLHALTGTPAVVKATGQGARYEDGVFGPRGRDGADLRRPALSAVFAIQEWFPGGPYSPRITRFDNPLSATPFPTDALPFHGHWGPVARDPAGVLADWIIPPTAPMPAMSA